VFRLATYSLGDYCSAELAATCTEARVSGHEPGSRSAAAACSRAAINTFLQKPPKQQATLHNNAMWKMTATQGVELQSSATLPGVCLKR